MTQPSHVMALRQRTLRWLMLVDLALFVDSTLRWELGFGFVRPMWVAAAAATLVGWLLVSSFLLKHRVNGLTHAVVAFPLACFTFVVASTGNPHFRWIHMPFFDMFRGGLFFNLLFDGGFTTGAIVAAAHGVIAQGLFRARKATAEAAATVWRGGIGLGLLFVCALALHPAIEIVADVPLPDLPGYFGIGDPRAASDGTVLAVSLTRWAIALCLGTLGVTQLMKSKRRVSHT